MSSCHWLPVIGLLATAPLTVHAQHAAGADTAPSRIWTSPLVVPGGALDELRRARQLLDGGATTGMIRASTSDVRWDTTGAPGVGIVPPALDYTWNARLPVSMNDGAMWAGRGSSYRLTGGVAAAYGPLHVVIAPEVTWSENQPVAILPGGADGRSRFASPWFHGRTSADLPIRFGGEPLRMVTTGQTRIEVRHRGVGVGASSEEQWWGPGVRNSIILSSNAPGIPHLFLRTTRPLRTPYGDVEARWIVGGLTESIFFDRDAGNDIRSLSAAIATFTPAFERGLTVGLARAVYSPADGGEVPLRFLDVLTRWHPSDSGATRPHEQITSLLARWVFQPAGAEVYGEWARSRFPRSLRDLFVAPQESQGFTVGTQAVRPAFLGGALRGQVEFTTLEQTPQRDTGLVESFYLSGRVPQGYTHRGQLVGAAIGPGSSSQWVALDYLRDAWSVGANFSRIRWHTDTYYRQPSGIERYAHDVSLMVGVRGSARVYGTLLAAEFVRTQRLNFLFQNTTNGFSRNRVYDVHDRSLRVFATWMP